MPLDVVKSAQPDDPIHQLRVAESEVHGVVRAEAGPGHDQERVRVLLGCERQHLGPHVVIVLGVTPRPVGRVLAAGVPALRIDAVDAKHLDPPLLQVLPERPHHPPIFPVEEAAHGRREDNHPRARMPEDEELHLPSEGWAVPAVVFTIPQTSLRGAVAAVLSNDVEFGQTGPECGAPAAAVQYRSTLGARWAVGGGRWAATKRRVPGQVQLRPWRRAGHPA